MQDPDSHPDPLDRGMDARIQIRIHSKMSLIRKLLASSCFSGNGSSLLPCTIAWLLLDKKGNFSSNGGNTINAASVFDDADSRTWKLRESQRNLFPSPYDTGYPIPFF
jgi:hypothetical protein